MRDVVYLVRRHKYLRRICRLLLNLAVLSLLGFLVWFGVSLFSGQWAYSPISGGLIFMAALAGFIWLSRVGLRSSWQPNMRITVVSLVALFFIFAFAGVQPLTNYKDVFVGSVSSLRSSLPVMSGYDVEILPGQACSIDSWFVSLDGGGWKGETLTVEISVVNRGSRRLFPSALLLAGRAFVAIDSTDKVVEPDRVLYGKEFYPSEKWAGSFVFEMSPYSGRTRVYLIGWHGKWYSLFDVGEPLK